MISFPKFMLILFLFGCSQNYFTDKETGVKIIFDYSDDIYPSHWLKGKIAGKGKSLKSSEYERSKKIIIKALRKYPNSMIYKNLKNIYILNQLNFFGVNYGGTFYERSLYIANSGVADGYTDSYVEKTFHHEFSSILMNNYSHLFNKDEWNKANDPTFKYGKGGIDAVINKNDNQDFSKYYFEKGVLNQYGSSSLDEDYSVYCENIFMDEPEFWEATKNYPRVKAKVKIIMNFYKKINSEINFKKIE